MSALEEAERTSSDRNGAPAVIGDVKDPKFSSEAKGDSPESRRTFGLEPPPKRNGSLSSDSMLSGQAGDDSAEDALGSPEGTTQSEQLTFFKDYYSQDEIRPGDLVSTLWAYQPRAADEFELERGDMIKIVGIWDDGWATGVRVHMSAEEWRASGQMLRDSGVSSHSNSGNTSPEADSSVKAFPLVCVCLPQHWKKTIEGDSTQGSGPPSVPPER